MFDLLLLLLALTATAGLLGTCYLLFRVGMLLTQTIEAQVAITQGLASTAQKSQEEVEQIKGWIYETNQASAQVEEKGEGVRQYCAHQYLELKKEVETLQESLRSIKVTDTQSFPN